MKVKRFVPALLAAMLAVAIATLVCLARYPDHAIVVPLQVRSGTVEIDRHRAIDSDKWHQRLLELANAPPASRDDEDGGNFERVLQRYLSLPPSSRSADTEATATGLAIERIEFALSRGQDERARSLCLRFRWSATRINLLAEACHRALSSGHRAQGATIRSHQNSLLIGGSHSPTRAAARRYLENPYDGERIYELAVQLAGQGRLAAAERLLEELLQIDLMAASRLEHALADDRGVEHHGHRFEFED